METASYFARKHGLEQYLDRPGELNEMILRLLVLQETMQGESARKRKDDQASIVSVRRPVGGKFVVACRGDGVYRYAVETALRAATAPVPVFQRGRFADTLRKMGVPEERIEEYCGSVTISDDTLCLDQD